MKPGSKPSRPPDDPLERARIAAQDARDIAKDELRRLPDYDDTEESTARHEIPHPINLTVNVRDSQQEVPTQKSEPPIKKQLKVGVAQVAMFIGLIIVTAVAGLLQNCGHH